MVLVFAQQFVAHADALKTLATENTENTEFTEKDKNKSFVFVLMRHLPGIARGCSGFKVGMVFSVSSVSELFSVLHACSDFGGAIPEVRHLRAGVAGHKRFVDAGGGIENMAFDRADVGAVNVDAD